MRSGVYQFLSGGQPGPLGGGDRDFGGSQPADLPSQPPWYSLFPDSRVPLLAPKYPFVEYTRRLGAAAPSRLVRDGGGRPGRDVFRIAARSPVAYSGAMPRSVVLNGTPRCERCQLPPRWCICAAFRPVPCPFQVDVLIHQRELHRPTSTGRLINRLVPSSRAHVFRAEAPPTRSSFVLPGRDVWVLHPLGEPIPTDAAPSNLQVILLDGSWREAVGMLRTAENWGRRIRLPMAGPSRYRLRVQHEAGNYSTIEALLFLLTALGLHSEHAQLQAQFELHVYAGLRARGDKKSAAAFLADSPARTAFPELLRQLDEKRPRV
jgi:DTW domain-containing protein